MSIFKFNNQIVPYRNSEQTVLEALEESGFYIPSSCLSGRCNFCLLQLDNGEVNESSQYNLSEKILKRSLFKSCVAKANNSIQCNDKYI